MSKKTWLMIFISIFLLSIIILVINPKTLIQVLKNAKLSYLLLALFLEFLSIIILTIRWNITIDSADIKVNKKDLILMLLVGMAINNITPSARGGGEPVRGYILSKYTESKLELAFATVMADKGLDLIPFITLSIITIISLALTTYHDELNIVILLILAVIIILVSCIAIFFISTNKEAGKKVIIWILNLIKKIYNGKKLENIEKKVITALNNFQNSIKDMLKNKRIFLYGIPLSFLAWILEILRIYVIFLSVGSEDISLIVIAEVFIVSTLVGMIPLLPGGVGIIDGIMLSIYTASGISLGIAGAATIIERIISFWLIMFLGLASIPYFGSEVFENIKKIYNDE